MKVSPEARKADTLKALAEVFRRWGEAGCPDWSEDRPQNAVSSRREQP